MKPEFKFPLVNAHTHAAMIAFRGMTEDLPLQKWLTDHIWPAEKQYVTSDFVYAKTKEALLEMKRNGIRIFSDFIFSWHKERRFFRQSWESKSPLLKYSESLFLKVFFLALKQH